MSGFGPDGRVKRGSRLANAAIDGAGLASEPFGGSGAEAALPSLRLTIEPPRSGHLVGFWLPAIALMAIACIGAERWQQFFALLPASVRAALAPPGFVPNPLARFEAAFFLAGLALLLWRNRGLIADVLRTLQPQDGRHALYAIAVLELLSFVTRPSSLGLDYQLLSLGPFGQHTGVFNRRILDVALAYYLHLGGAFFILFHFLTVFGLLAMTRAYLRRLGAEPSFLVFVSIASSAFIIFNFQYPGYPDPLVLMLVLAAVLAEIDLEGLLFVIVLALLAHEALALALFLPLAPLVPRRVWPVLALPFAIYGLLWLTDFGFDVVAGWTAQALSGAFRPQRVSQSAVGRSLRPPCREQAALGGDRRSVGLCRAAMGSGRSCTPRGAAFCHGRDLDPLLRQLADGRGRVPDLAVGVERVGRAPAAAHRARRRGCESVTAQRLCQPLFSAPVRRGLDARALFRL